MTLKFQIILESLEIQINIRLNDDEHFPRGNNCQYIMVAVKGRVHLWTFDQCESEIAQLRAIDLGGRARSTITSS